LRIDQARYGLPGIQETLLGALISAVTEAGMLKQLSTG